MKDLYPPYDPENPYPTKNPHKLLFRDLATIIPRMAEAEKHGNRPLVLSLANDILKRIGSNLELTFVRDEQRKAYNVIRREIKQFLIKGAYREEPVKRATKKKKGSIGRWIDGGGVFQANTKSASSLGMRDVKSETDHSETDTEDPSTITADQSTITNDHQTAPTPMITADPPPEKKYTISQEIELDKPSSTCDKDQGPFSINDFTLTTRQEKEATLDDLIVAVDRIIKEVNDA